MRVILEAVLFRSRPWLTKDLKRFSGFGFRSKLQTNVEFPHTLDLGDFAADSRGECSPPCEFCVPSFKVPNATPFYGWLWPAMRQCGPATKLRPTHNVMLTREPVYMYTWVGHRTWAGSSYCLPAVANTATSLRAAQDACVPEFRIRRTFCANTMCNVWSNVFTWPMLWRQCSRT